MTRSVEQSVAFRVEVRGMSVDLAMPVPVRLDRRCRNQPSADRGHLEDYRDSKADPELLDGRVAVEPEAAERERHLERCGSACTCHQSGQLDQAAEHARWKIAVSTQYATTIDNTFATQPALRSPMVRKARVSGVRLTRDPGRPPRHRPVDGAVV